MVALPHPAVTAVRVVSVCVVIAFLAGCAGSSHQSIEPPEDYFSMTLPGMAKGVSPQMSPVSNSLDQLRSFQTPPPTLVRQALLEQHQRWSGDAHRIGGTSERGIDCSALVRNVYRDTFNPELPRSTSGQIHEGRSIDRQELQAGDLVSSVRQGVITMWVSMSEMATFYMPLPHKASSFPVWITATGSVITGSHVGRWNPPTLLI